MRRSPSVGAEVELVLRGAAPRWRRLPPLRPEEVLAERVLLPLVVGRAAGVAVEQRRLGEHALERELADALAVLDVERHVVSAHFERGARPVEAAVAVVAEAGIEEAGVVRAQL